MFHATDRIAHTTVFVTPVMEYLQEREIVQWFLSGFCFVVFLFCFFLKLLFNTLFHESPYLTVVVSIHVTWIYSL